MLRWREMRESAEPEKKPGIHGEEVVLTFLFGVLLVGVFSVLLLDYRQLTGHDLSFNFPFRDAPVTTPIRPARDSDQLRRYTPQTRVFFGPGSKVTLPGVAGDADKLLHGSMTFHRGEDGSVSAVGLIDPGSFTRFETFLAEETAAPITTLYLHSPGGSVNDAINMALLIRDLGLSTVIAENGYCASSCPLAFAGGVERTILKPAALGVHQVFTSDSAIGTLQDGIADAQAVSARAQQLLVDMGVDPRAWIQAMQTPKDQLYLFTEEEIADLAWITPKDG